MNLVDAFIWATAYAYLAGALLPIRFEKKMESTVQRIFFFAMFLIYLSVLIVSYLNGVSPLATPYRLVYNTCLFSLGVLYSFLTVWCWGGGQDWGSTNNNIAMAAWDLTLAVAFFSKVF